MEKIRVYELAKELNTTSKRLMEKLGEINVDVKNHMSLLEDDQLQALYKHIGIIKHDDVKKSDLSEPKKAVTPPPPKPEHKKDAGKDAKSAPRIIRKTEIIIDSASEQSNSNQKRSDSKFGHYGNDNKRDQKSDSKWDIIRVADDSGLRAGYVRKTKPEFIKNDRPAAKVENTGQPAPKDVARQEINQQEGKDRQPDVQKSVPSDTKHEKEQEKPVVKTVESIEIKNPEKAEEKPVAALTEKPENVIPEKQESKSAQGKEEPTADAKPQIKSEGQRNDGPRNHGPRNNGPRPEGQRFDGPRNNGPRPEGQRYDGPRNNGPRPEGQRYDGPRNNGPRPEGQRYDGPRNNGPRPNENRYGQGSAPTGDRRPEGGFNRGQQGQGQGQFNRNRGPADRRPQSGGAFRPGGRPLEIPKPEFTAAQLEEMNAQRGETRREFQNKDIDKDNRREQKKDISKIQSAGKAKKFKPQTVVIVEKKGVSEILSEDFILDEFYSDDGGIKKTKKPAKQKKEATAVHGNKHIPHKAVLTSVKLGEFISVKDLAETLKKTATEVIRKLMALGMMVTLNQEIDFDTAAIVAEEFGIKAEKEVVVNEEDILFDDTEENEDELEPRPPVVVVMGHVDHGKTSLLDAIREANVTASEAGGITQHIGAYMVKINGRSITFLDTPGHEAFTAMRARGAQVTDIAILVVAADDGIMPQTIEAINHAKAANVSIIVAINKIDKPGANPDKIKQELTEHGLVAEEWGGDVICVPVSAKQRTNIDQLLEMVLLTADILELKANPNRQAKGTIIEAKLDKARGAIATLLVQRGTLKVGDSIVTGTTVGRIRAMTDDKGNKIKKAKPSTPVEILGLPEVPEAGEIFYAITDEKVAKQLAEKRKIKLREQQLKASARVSLDDLFNQIKEGKVKDLNIIVKADVQGSVEAVKQSLTKLSNEEVRVRIIHGGVGAINEHDVNLAQVSNAIIIGFNVRPGANAAEAAKDANVDIRLYRVIYNAIEDIQAAMKGMLEPTYKEVVLGHAEVRQVFKVSGIGTIGGCYVTDGKIVRNTDVRIVRDGIVIHEGKLASLKRFKDDAKEVAQGFECGLSIERFNDIKEGDIVESYTMEEVKR